jgi:hypothetical protein
MRSQALDTGFLPRRVSWSPDGTCFIAASFSNDLSIFSKSDSSFSLSLSQRFPSTITAAVWYPGMTSLDPASCAFASVCPFYPIQLIDSLDGHVRSCYRCQQGGDRPAPICSLLFSGSSILAGGVRTLFECNIVRCDVLGRSIVSCRGSVVSLLGDDRHSAICLGLSTGEVLIVDAATRQPVLSLAPHEHAVDSVCWNGDKFMSSARLEDTVFGFDLRSPAAPEFRLVTARRSSRFVSLESAADVVVLGSEEQQAAVYRLCDLAEQPDMVGSGRTPIAAIDGAGEKIAAASGGFVFVQGEEEDDSDASFEPKLEAFSVILRGDELSGFSLPQATAPLSI